MLLAYPNVSEGRDPGAIGRVAAAFGPGLIDAHSDPDHHRTAFTLAGEPGRLAEAVLAGAAEIVRELDLRAHDGVHPRVGALDVAPIVHVSDGDRGAACAEALVLADLLAERLGLPVFLYGALAGGRTRAQLRRGGPEALAARIRDGELRPDFGPARLHHRAGAVLVAARPPLVAFNVVLAPPAGLERARRIAADIREGGPGGLAGVRAIGLWLERAGVAQVSTNIDDPGRTTAADVVAAIARHSTTATTATTAARVEIAELELVGLAPESALAGLPAGLPLRNRHTIEDALQRVRRSPHTA